ncbi:autotransporter domain-containing protein [Psychrobacter sp. APC 3279]|uniref:autotransporter domain-containing protein n=1 Tax=Psychrobacter sp. APC 3279 TaxID=3035189 RepID=UPI0025B49B61|nr:autotransporter domain-containing protein [Psychrobacter sp. APC 3279]MDN3441408.1 autotransporter domain-containing protein [Psychrobacter sp. APC 3279]
MDTNLSPLKISVVATLTLLTGSQVFAEAKYGDYGTETALTLARDYAGRYTGSDKEVQAADYMQQRMTIDGSNNQVNRQTFDFVAPRGLFRGQTLTSNNVVVTQKGSADTNRTLFVGAHYDSAVAYPNYENLEALDDNASGSGVLTELTKNLTGIETEHDIQFVAFGAEEGGLNGSKAFVDQLTDAEKSTALGMINLDSLITGDKMYANAGRNAYDNDGDEVAANVSLRENALRIAKELGITLEVNPAIIAPGETEPYEPYGVGCCSDQESFDSVMQVVGFEATNWGLGPDYDGYTQTENPDIPGGYTWHNPALDNEEVLTAAFGEERIAQRMRDYSRIISRLIVEQTNADIIASTKSALNLQNTMGTALKNNATDSHSAVLERANALALHTLDDAQLFDTESRTQVWVDGSQSYVDADEVQEGIRANIGLYGEYMVQPSWRVGAGVQAANQNNNTVENGIKKDTSYGIQAYSLLGGKDTAWWNTTSLSLSKHDLDVNRTVKLDGNDGINIINNSERGDADADVFSAYNELGYNFLIKKNVAHGAFLGLNYSDTDIDGYTSGNANSHTALKVDSTSSEAWDSELGYQLQYGFDLMGTPAKLQSKIAYVHVIDDGLTDSLSTTSLADGQTREVSITQVDKDDDYGRFELSVSNKVHKNVYAYLNGDTTFARDDKDSSVQLGLQYQF